MTITIAVDKTNDKAGNKIVRPKVKLYDCNDNS